MSEELFPCPFCGATDERLEQAFTRATDDFAFWSVECLDCGVEVVDDESQAAADAAWNRRTPDTTARATEPAGDDVERLMHVIDRDRYVVAHCVGEIEREIRGREWLTQGRGFYEWDDDRFYDEFADAIAAIRVAAQPLAIMAWDKSDCTRIEERVNAARLAAREMLSKPIEPRQMITANIFGDLRDAEIERLRAELAALHPTDDLRRTKEALNRLRKPEFLGTPGMTEHMAEVRGWNAAIDAALSTVSKEREHGN